MTNEARHAVSPVDCGLKEGRERPVIGDRRVVRKCVIYQPQALFTIHVPLIQLGGQLFRPRFFEQHGNSLLLGKMHLKKMESIRLQDRHGSAALTGMPPFVFVNDPAVFLGSSIFKSGSPAAWDGARVTGCRSWVGIPLDPDRAALCADRCTIFLVDLRKNMDPGVWVNDVSAAHLALEFTQMGGAPVKHSSLWPGSVHIGGTANGTNSGTISLVDLPENVPGLPGGKPACAAGL